MHLLFIAVQKVTSKLSSLRRQIIVIKQFRRTRPPRAAEPSAFGSRSLEAAVRLLATVAVVRRLAWGWRVWFQVHSGGCGRRRHILLCPPGAAPEVVAPSTREMRDARCERRHRWKWPVRVARFRRRHPSLSPRSVGRVDQPGTAWGAGSRWRTERWWRSVQRSEGTTQDGPAGRLGGGAEGRPCLQREQAPRTPGRGQGAPGFRDMRLCRGFAWALGHGPYW